MQEIQEVQLADLHNGLMGLTKYVKGELAEVRQDIRKVRQDIRKVRQDIEEIKNILRRR